MGSKTQFKGSETRNHAVCWLAVSLAGVTISNDMTYFDCKKFEFVCK